MHKALLSLAVLASLAFAGCGEKHDSVDPVTCPDGTVLAAEDIEAVDGHHGDGFNATSHCPEPPSVRLEGVPASLGAFKAGSFSWTLDNGTVHHAHSMLTSIRYSEASVPDADLTAVTKYPSELIKREHQDLPVTYKGNMTFSKVGKVYLRAYMEVAGKDYWSPEVVVDVTPVVPTGKVVEFTIPPAAGVAGDITPAEQIVVLGDAVKVVNEDPVPRTCTRTSGPAETQPLGDGEGAAESIVMVVPGVYEFSCDTLQERGFKVIVNV
jgi:plastocyanin